MRFNTGTLTVAIFAILFGLIGAYALRAAMTREAPPAKEAPRTVSVPLATNYLPAGRKITLGDMGLVPMTQEMIVTRKYPLETLMISSEQIVGRILKEELKPGEPFLTTNMYPEGTGPSLADKLRPGLRALTIPIDDLSSVGAATVPGSIVDILFRSKAAPADRAQRLPAIPEATVTLVQNVEVIAVGRNEALTSARDPRTDVDVRNSNRKQDGSLFRSVTLAVTPEQANMLRAAMGHGDLSLALSSAASPAAGTQAPLTLDKLLGLKAPPEPFTMEVYRGKGRQSVTFEEGQVIDEKFWEDRANDGKKDQAKPNDQAKNKDKDEANNRGNKPFSTPIDWSRWRPTYGGFGGYGGYGGGDYNGWGTNYSIDNVGYGAGFGGFGN
jgi:pilus assembly protein CpaB